MIMPRGQQLLLPVDPVFIGASFGSSAGHQHAALGRVLWMPDVLMVLLAFWGVRGLWCGHGAGLVSVCAWTFTSLRCWASMRWPMRWCCLAPP